MANTPRDRQSQGGWPRVRWAERLLGHHPLFAWGILAASLVVTVIAWWVATSYAERRASDRFSFVVNDITTAINDRMTEYEMALRAGVGLLGIKPDLTRDQWRAFHQDLDIARTHPGIQGYGFAKALSPGDVAAHEAAVKAEGYPDYHVHPLGDGALTTAIVFLEPFNERNQRAFGFDMFSEPTRRAAMELARDSGEPALSGKVTLVQETGEDVQSGALLYLPLYQPNSDHTTVAGRRDGLIGWVYGAFRMKDLMRGILGGGMNGVTFALYDGPTARADSLLFKTDDPPVLQALTPATAGVLTETRTIIIAGRAWTLRVATEDAFLSDVEASQPTIIAAAGFTVDCLLFIIVTTMARRQREARQFATEMTREAVAARETAERANHAKTEFLARMSHELRTPLNAIIGFADMMRQEVFGPVGSPRYAQYVKAIHDSGTHLLSLVAQVLDMSAIEAGKLEFRHEVIALDDVIPQAVAMTAPQFQKAKVRLEETIAEAPRPVYADRRAVIQVLINLLGNAAKFTPEGGRVTITLTNDLANGTLLIEVADTGIGIAPEDLADLAQPFTRARDNHIDGTGLGLAISRSLVELQGGAFSLTSTPGEGTTVSFTLPLAVSR